MSNCNTSNQMIESSYQGASDKAIQHHYDLSNDFYKLWLDQTLTYSCALWEQNEGYDALSLAQERKLDFYAERAKVSGVAKVLEIGCGWGALLRRLIKAHDVQEVVGLTLSQAQLEHIVAFNEPKINVRLENWFDHLPKQPYDAIISIEAFEAFVKFGLSQEEKIEAYHKFFQKCHQWLKPGRFMSFQTIAYGNMTPEDIKPLIVNNIFPESDLPCLVEIVAALAPMFEVVELRNDRQDYVRTLKVWLKNLKENREEVSSIVGEKVVNDYEKYLQHSIFGFASGAQNLFRITICRIDKIY